jgi:ubiquinone/menaquinone biosynthesis C-methylase UbiE
MSQEHELFENEHVHKIYSKIASDFDRTRVNNWRYVEEFIQETPVDPNIKIADIGMGNGKYMLLRKDQFYGCDMCQELVDICVAKGLNAVRGDIMKIPFDIESFDKVICIAVLHHLSSEERRLDAIKELIRITKKDGKILITVWACEDEGEANKKKKSFIQFPEKSVNMTEQDVSVPWKKFDEHMGDRYYHLFKEKELFDLCKKITGVNIIDYLYERGNWNIVLHKTM